MNKWLLLTLVILAVATIGFGLSRINNPAPVTKTVTASFKNGYLPLGDSYTIGESIDPGGNYPNQLVNRLRTSVSGLGIVANKSVTGYTTADLIKYELPLVAQTKPTFVTILIGVNDYVQSVDSTTFEKNLRYIVDTTRQNMTQPNNIIMLTIPDYAKTPSGVRYGDPDQATTAITKFNTIIKQVASDNNLAVVDIFQISQQASVNPALTANDGLHPSAQQYSLWTDLLLPVVQERISFN